MILCFSWEKREKIHGLSVRKGSPFGKVEEGESGCRCKSSALTEAYQS